MSQEGGRGLPRALAAAYASLSADADRIRSSRRLVPLWHKSSERRLLILLRLNRECANSESASHSQPELLLERQQVTEAERLHAHAAVRDDVVPELEHA